MTSMNHNIVLDISSDEEEDGKRLDYFDLFDGVLKTLDEKPKSIAFLDPTVKIEDGDDDCVILDCDPTPKDTAVDTCETDEVLVTGQKGEIACRDFPHPRHACAKYSFKSTSHQQYCEMCHCYVCDTRSPCPYWFSGFSNIDHCHANDKEQTWKNQREWIRTGKMLPRPVSKPYPTIPQLQRVSQPPSVPLPGFSASPVTQFGIHACSTPTTVSTHPSTYTRPGYTAEQSRAFPQTPGSQPCTVQSFPNPRGGSYNGNPRPQAVPSNPYVWTRRLSNGVYRPENIAQGSQPICYAPPVASQGNPQRIVTGYISTVPESHCKVYARQFNRNLYSGTSAVPSETPIPPVNQQQQQQEELGRSKDKVLSELEDWLLDDSTLFCPLSGQDTAATTFKYDFETLLK